MDGQTLLLVGIVAAGVYTVYKLNGETLPSIPLSYLAPTKRPDFPSPTESVNYPNPPASQTPSLPDPLASGVCTISTRADFSAWTGDTGVFGLSDDDYNTALTAEKANAGCFSPPNK
jgi:hypothetical protein